MPLRPEIQARAADSGRAPAENGLTPPEPVTFSSSLGFWLT